MIKNQVVLRFGGKNKVYYTGDPKIIPKEVKPKGSGREVFMELQREIWSQNVLSIGDYFLQCTS